MKLNVYFENTLVGELERDEERIFSFTYEDSWCEENQQAFPLSLSMPLTQRTFGTLREH